MNTETNLPVILHTEKHAFDRTNVKSMMEITGRVMIKLRLDWPDKIIMISDDKDHNFIFNVLESNSLDKIDTNWQHCKNPDGSNYKDTDPIRNMLGIGLATDITKLRCLEKSAINDIEIANNTTYPNSIKLDIIRHLLRKFFGEKLSLLAEKPKQ